MYLRGQSMLLDQSGNDVSAEVAVVRNALGYAFWQSFHTDEANAAKNLSNEVRDSPLTATLRAARVAMDRLVNSYVGAVKVIDGEVAAPDVSAAVDS
jgi:hypothetical protein